ncbi:hypothetical protein ACPYO6_04000 [Georgenia sp. Z1344]|uniref:hypothetical protein n=1 Tax=Georgenia sp. Z1344 TaxID=3416706 RepID=UPI003CF3E3D5
MDRDLLDVALTGSDADRREAERLVAASRQGDATPGRARALVGAAEAAARAGGALVGDPAGGYDLVVGERTYRAGRFSTPTIGELRRRAVDAGESGATARSGERGSSPVLSVLHGGGTTADIGALQAFAAGGTLFQVASQFNCLESPGPSLVPVADYLSDPTQGPRASIGAFPGTLLRHYAAPDGAGGTFEQRAGRQVDLLADALPAHLGAVRSGYLSAQYLADLPAVAEALAERFEDIRVGVQDDVEVVLGAGWHGRVDGRPRIAQVLTAALAHGGYGDGATTGAHLDVMRQLLRAAYLGTLLGALATGRERVVLTLVGGGVFGNPHALVVESLLWALEELAPLARGPLEVVVNAFDLAPDARPALARAVERTGGIWRDTA